MTLRKELPVPNATGREDIVAIDIYGIDEVAECIYNYGINEAGEVCSESFTLMYKGKYKNVPFTLTTAEINQLKNPTDSNNES
jgi:hypothetical protein